MIAVFTNAKGEVNRGTVLDIHDSGLLKIQWEPFYRDCPVEPLPLGLGYKGLNERSE